MYTTVQHFGEKNTIFNTNQIKHTLNVIVNVIYIICLDLIRCILYSFLFYFYTSFLFLWLICWQYFPVLLLHPNSRLTFLTQDNDTLRRNKSFSFRWLSQAVNSLFCVNHILINRLWMARIVRALLVTSFLLLTKLPCLKNRWIACLETVHFRICAFTSNRIGAIFENERSSSAGCQHHFVLRARS